MPDHPSQPPQNADSPPSEAVAAAGSGIDRGTRRIAVVTSGRADYGLLRPVLAALAVQPGTALIVHATGAHLSARHGMTIDRIRTEGWDAIETVETETHPDRPMADKVAAGVAGFAAAFAEHRPDVCVLLGDRFETMSAAVASSTSGVPIAHIHGGEISTGALDNQFRYAITALANLHCVATAKARDRLIAMGESPEAVIRTGAPGLDALAGFEPMPRDAFCREAGLGDDAPFLLVTLHPETIGQADATTQASTLVRALEAVGMPVLTTAANQDPAGNAINAVLEDACARYGWAYSRVLGPLYLVAMHHAAAMVGNSSSGIIEAASFGLAVVNIGERQGGRERSGNVLDCAHGADAISSTVRGALATDVSGAVNLYAAPVDGGPLLASERIARAVAAMPLGAAGLRKQFEPPGLT